MRRINITSLEINTNMLHGCNYWFYDHSQNYNVEPMLYKQLLQKAEHAVDIWDPFFNVNDKSNIDRSFDDDSMLFAYFLKPVHVRYLMNKNLITEETYNEWENNISQKVISGLKKTMKIEFSNISKKNDRHTSRFWEFHDRFLIIDRKEVYLIGASVGYHLNPTHSTGICKLTEDADIDLVIEEFDRFWKTATKLNGIRKMAL